LQPTLITLDFPHAKDFVEAVTGFEDVGTLRIPLQKWEGHLPDVLVGRSYQILGISALAEGLGKRAETHLDKANDFLVDTPYEALNEDLRGLLHFYGGDYIEAAAAFQRAADRTHDVMLRVTREERAEMARQFIGLLTPVK
jgi:hypothetical protein